MKPIAICFFFFFSWFSQAQSHSNFRRFNFSQNGLAVGSIEDMAVDNDGFFWVSGSASDVYWKIFSRKGPFLQRFDGSNFQTIKVPEIEGAINLDHIGQIVKNTEGNFYLRITGKEWQVLITFDPSSVQFELLRFPGDKNHFRTYSNIFLYHGRFFVVSQKGKNVVLLEIKKNKFVELAKIENPQGQKINIATEFIPFEKGFLLSTNSSGIYFYDWSGKMLQTPQNLLRGTTIFKDISWINGKVAFDKTDYFHIGQKSALYTFSPSKMQIIPSVKFGSLLEQVQNYRLWNDTKKNLLLSVGSAEGLDLYQWANNEFILKTAVSSQKMSERTKFFSQDIDQGFWMGNPGYEIKYYSFPSNTVQRFLQDKSIRTIFPIDSAHVLVGTEFSGLYKIGLDTGEVEPFILYDGKQVILPLGTRNIVRGKKPGHIWTNDKFGFLHIDLHGNQVEYYKTEPMECFVKLNDSILVYGTKNRGLGTFNMNSHGTRQLTTADSLWILDLLIKDEIIYAATNKGLLTYHVDSKESSFYNPFQNPEDNYFMCLLPKKSSVLLGTKSGKVVQFNPGPKTFDIFFESKMSAPVASLIYFNKTLWINTFLGFIALDPATGEKTRYSMNDGFTSDEANRYSVLAFGKGLLIGTVKGLNYFDPKEIKANKSFCNLTPLKIKVFDKEKEDFVKILNREKLKNHPKIVLPAENRFFQLNFGTGTCFLSNNLIYQYRLNKGQWMPLDHNHFVRFGSMAPGNYELEVAAFGFSGKKIGDSLKFQILAKNFFYNTWWFRSGIVLLAIFILWALYLAKMRKIKREALLRTSISSDLHDEVGGLLTAISMRAELLQYTEMEQGMKKDFVATIAKSSKEAIQAMRDVVWSIDSRNDDWESLLNHLREYGNRLFEDSGTDFIIEVDGAPPKSLLQKPRQGIYLICKEALNNIAKHAGATEVKFLCEFSRHRTKLSIADNGKGIKKQEKSSGQGLKNMKMRSEKIKAELFFAPVKVGTEMSLILGNGQ